MEKEETQKQAEVIEKKVESNLLPPTLQRIVEEGKKESKVESFWHAEWLDD